MKKVFLFVSILLVVLFITSCNSKAPDTDGKKIPSTKLFTFFYDENWKISPEYKAEFYRTVLFDTSENPVGEINDYLISGEKCANYEQAISFDKDDVSKCVFAGKITFYHKNGEVKQAFSQDIKGQKQGWFYEYSKNGKLTRKIEYKDDVVVNEFEYQYIETGNDDESSYKMIQTLKTMKPLELNANLPMSPQISFEKHYRYPAFRDYIKKFRLGDNKSGLIEACNYQNDVVRNSAVMLASYSPGEFNLGQICDIFDFCYQNWSYVNDPISRDYFAKASETIDNKLNGDCDDFAILMCSMILSVGGEARINFVYYGNSGHAFTEVNIGTTDIWTVNSYLKSRYKKFSKASYRTDEYGNKWLNLDWWADHPGGKYYNYTSGEVFNIIYNTYQKF